MKIGVVGLPNVGKSTLFNSLTNAGAEAANYPFCTIEPNSGIAPVKDERLNVLSKMTGSEKIIPAVTEFLDIAGLVKGASKGEGLGNKFLSHIREVNAILQVVRCFEDDNIVKTGSSPSDDAETINLELILADIETCESRQLKLKNSLKAGDKNAAAENEVLEKVKATLLANKFASKTELDEKEKEIAKRFFLLTNKPMLYVANISEKDLEKIQKTENKTGNDFKTGLSLVDELMDYAKRNGDEVLIVSAKIEADLNELAEDEREMFMEELGIKERALDKLINACYKILGLISYLTSGEKETRAWTIKKGFKAPEAAGVIHTDFEKGFIKAEVVSYADLTTAGSMQKAKELGKVRQEGKEYVMQDGDVVVFKFNR